MQIIEANRHRAELLEERANAGSVEHRRLLLAIAAQRRDIADQFHDLSQGRPLTPIRPLLRQDDES